MNRRLREWLSVFLGFAAIGLTAFGGGSATIVAMRRLCVRKGWLTEDEFLDTLVQSRLTPGITIVAQVLLIGRRVSGTPGMLAGAVGLLAPAVTITILLSQLYEVVSRYPLARTPLACVIGVSAGFAVALLVQLLKDTLRVGRRLAGPLMVIAYFGLDRLIGNPVLVLLSAAAVGACAPRLFLAEAPDEP